MSDEHRVSTVTNLRQERKRRARLAKQDTAAANRIQFGTPKPLRAAQDVERTRSVTRLDGKRLDPGQNSEESGQE